jgi:hypothetical protein
MSLTTSEDNLIHRLRNSWGLSPAEVRAVRREAADRLEAAWAREARLRAVLARIVEAAQLGAHQDGFEGDDA